MSLGACDWTPARFLESRFHHIDIDDMLWHAQRCRQLFAVLISCHETDSAADRIWSCHLWMFMKRTMSTAALVMRIEATNRPIDCKHVTQFVSVHTCSHSSPPDWALRVTIIIIVLGWVNFKVPDCGPPTGRLLALQITKFLVSSFYHLSTTLDMHCAFSTFSNGVFT